jgi:CRISPR-associated protein Cmr1
MRKPPAGTPPNVPDTSAARAGFVKQQRRYELITPLFGGGVQAGTNDPVTIIRGASIRGQLRFWWRACRGGAFNGNLANMKAREDAIWGAPASEQGGGPSQVAISVEILNEGKPFRVTDNKGDPIDVGHFRSPYSYVAFPLESGQTVQEGVDFTLTITYPQSILMPDKTSLSLIEEVEAAFWAWETFGGIGARTRRGFGALRLVSVDENGKTIEVQLPPANPNQVKQWLRENLDDIVVAGDWKDNVPHLHLPHLAVKGIGKPLDVWRGLFDKLKRFRQDRFPDRKGGSGRGCSKWPEPSATRDLTGQSLPAHSNPIPDPLIDKFPRAAFGLPIGFQFKDADKYDPNKSTADPRKTSLEFESHDRLASPLILKPLACKDGKAVGIALVLQGTGLFREEDGTRVPREQPILKTKERPDAEWTVDVQLTAAEAHQIPMLNGNPDVLQAFLDYLNQ